LKKKKVKKKVMLKKMFRLKCVIKKMLKKCCFIEESKNTEMPEFVVK
jgi:hypothetical protein